MPRYAKSISKNELSEKLANIKNLQLIPYKDFNLEVHLTEDDEVNIYDIYEQDNNVFALVSAKSKYETLPIYFMVYVDINDHLRAFVPKHGNIYNPWTGTAFGSERAWKVKTKSITKMPEQYYEENHEQGGFKESQSYKDEFEIMKPNIPLMINEFTRFIQVI